MLEIWYTYVKKDTEHFLILHIFCTGHRKRIRGRWRGGGVWEAGGPDPTPLSPFGVQSQTKAQSKAEA